MTNKMFRAYRLYLDLTQDEFARVLGVSKAQIGRIETGSMEVSPRIKAKLLSKYEIDQPFLTFFEKMSEKY